MHVGHNWPLQLLHRFLGNMDETPVYFDIVPGKTIERRGRKTVKVRTTGSEKRHITVVLAATASGLFLPPMIIFKGVVVNVC